MISILQGKPWLFFFGTQALETSSVILTTPPTNHIALGQPVKEDLTPSFPPSHTVSSTSPKPHVGVLHTATT